MKLSKLDHGANSSLIAFSSMVWQTRDLFSTDRAKEIMRAYADYSQEAPDELSLDLIMAAPADGKPGALIIHGVYSGDHAEGLAGVDNAHGPGSCNHGVHCLPDRIHQIVGGFNAVRQSFNCFERNARLRRRDLNSYVLAVNYGCRISKAVVLLRLLSEG